MSLADSLKQHRTTRKGPRCTVCELVEALPVEDRDALLVAFADATYPTSAIARALRAEGHNVLQSTVGRHRRGECAG